MAQNTSSAVMQQRKEPNESLDYFPTQAWATRAFCEQLMQIMRISTLTVWEPACGEGHMSRPLAEFFASVYSSDVHDYSATFPEQDDVCDFLCEWDHPSQFGPVGNGVDWIITNFPFRLGEEFIQTALMRAKVGAAFFVRTSFLEGQERYRSLYSVTPPAHVFQFAERVPLLKGRVEKSASSATSYCWIVFLKGHSGATLFHWIPPCRDRLERPADYPTEPQEPEPAPLLDWGGAQ